jgi:membrane-bound metal-dependent hydrolase YbcI (DUF457 family)
VAAGADVPAIAVAAMMAHGHTVSGVLAGGLTLPLLDVPVPHRAGYLVVCAVFALVPDLDHRSARLSRYLPPITTLLCKLLTWMSKVAFYASREEKDARKSNGHRGLTHTFVFAFALFPLALSVLVPLGVSYAGLWALACTVGALAHILGDCCTEHGCPVLWPLQIGGQRWRRLGIPVWFRFKTGKRVEKLVISPMLVVLASVVLAWQVPGVPNLVGMLFDGAAAVMS